MSTVIPFPHTARKEEPQQEDDRPNPRCFGRGFGNLPECVCAILAGELGWT